jgi:TRAP-type C4-dicarboxylate transport system permease small subunit
MLLRLLDGIHVVLRVLVGAIFCVLLAAVLMQVVSRLSLPRPPVWTEELSRFALLFTAAVGAGLSLRTGDLVNVDVVTSLLPEGTRRGLEAVVMLVMIGFCAALVMPAWDFTDIGSLQDSPALGWNMFWVHAAMLLAPLTLGLACLERLARILAGVR